MEAYRMLFQVVNFSFDIGFRQSATISGSSSDMLFYLGEDMLICGRTIVSFENRVFNGAYTAHIDNQLYFRSELVLPYILFPRRYSFAFSTL